jgi:hypothetical protein
MIYPLLISCFELACLLLIAAMAGMIAGAQVQDWQERRRTRRELLKRFEPTETEKEIADLERMWMR